MPAAVKAVQPVNVVRAKVLTAEHWVDKDSIPIYLWERPAGAMPRLGTILFVHGSSMSGKPSFDLEIPGAPYVSPMAWFSAVGFDTWSIDCEGYGRSGKSRPINCDISTGADDIAAAAPYIMERSENEPLHIFGVSSGALRAGLFAQRHPNWVRRLALDATVWTGADSRTLADRRTRHARYESELRRPVSRESVRAIFTRDREGSSDEAFVEAFADAILAVDDSVPNGSYVDMCKNLPILDPTAISAPTLIMRGEHDGIASLDDVLAFFRELPNFDKHFAMLKGSGHAAFHGKYTATAYHVLRAFFTQKDTL